MNCFVKLLIVVKTFRLFGFGYRWYVDVHDCDGVAQTQVLKPTIYMAVIIFVIFKKAVRAQMMVFKLIE